MKSGGSERNRFHPRESRNSVRRVKLAFAAALLVAPILYGHEGWGIVLDPRRGVIVSDIPGNTIWRIAGGRITPLIRDVHSHELVLTADGVLYGSDPKPSGATASVWQLDVDGRFSYVIPPANDLQLGLQSFLITEDGTIYSAARYDPKSSRIALLRRDRTGNVEEVDGDFSAIDGMKSLPGGGVLLVDGAHLRRITSSGEVLTVAGPLTRRRWGEDLLGISSVRGPTVHVADHAGRRVLRVDLRTREAKEVYRSSLLWSPSGLEVDRKGTLYVLEHLRPPLSLLGDLQIGPYLRVRGSGSGTIGVVWGRRTWHAAAVILALVGGISLVARTLRAAHGVPSR